MLTPLKKLFFLTFCSKCYFVKTFKLQNKNEIKLCHDSQIDVKTVHTNKLKSNNKIAISLNNKLLLFSFLFPYNFLNETRKKINIQR